MDFDKYKNKTPWPDKSEIRDALIAEMFPNGIPAGLKIDGDAFDKEHVTPKYKELIFTYRESEAEIRKVFEADMESEHGMTELPKKCRDFIHGAAWQEGHSSGYSEVHLCYYDLVEAAKLAREEI